MKRFSLGKKGRETEEVDVFDYQEVLDQIVNKHMKNYKSESDINRVGLLSYQDITRTNYTPAQKTRLSQDLAEGLVIFNKNVKYSLFYYFLLDNQMAKNLLFSHFKPNNCLNNGISKILLWLALDKESPLVYLRDGIATGYGFNIYILSTSVHSKLVDFLIQLVITRPNDSLARLDDFIDNHIIASNLSYTGWVASKAVHLTISDLHKLIRFIIYIYLGAFGLYITPPPEGWVNSDNSWILQKILAKYGEDDGSTDFGNLLRKKLLDLSLSEGKECDTACNKMLKVLFPNVTEQNNIWRIEIGEEWKEFRSQEEAIMNYNEYWLDQPTNKKATKQYFEERKIAYQNAQKVWNNCPINVEQFKQEVPKLGELVNVWDKKTRSWKDGIVRKVGGDPLLFDLELVNGQGYLRDVPFVNISKDNNFLTGFGEHNRKVLEAWSSHLSKHEELSDKTKQEGSERDEEMEHKGPPENSILDLAIRDALNDQLNHISVAITYSIFKPNTCDNRGISQILLWLSLDYHSPLVDPQPPLNLILNPQKLPILCQHLAELGSLNSDKTLELLENLLHTFSKDKIIKMGTGVLIKAHRYDPDKFIANLVKYIIYLFLEPFGLEVDLNEKRLKLVNWAIKLGFKDTPSLEQLLKTKLLEASNLSCFNLCKTENFKDNLADTQGIITRWEICNKVLLVDDIIEVIMLDNKDDIFAIWKKHIYHSRTKSRDFIKSLQEDRFQYTLPDYNRLRNNLESKIGRKLTKAEKDDLVKPKLAELTDLSPKALSTYLDKGGLMILESLFKNENL